MRVLVSLLFVMALLLSGGCSEQTQELSTTDPDGTLPVPSDAGPADPPRTDAAPATAPSTAPAPPEVSGDDSGFDADTTRTGQDVPTPTTNTTT